MKSKGLKLFCGAALGFCGLLGVFSPAAFGQSPAPELNGDGKLNLAAAKAISDTVSIPLQVSTSTVTLTPTSLNFGTQLLGATSAPQTVTLTNTGSVLLSITSVAANGDFTQTNTCGNSVASGAACTISVTFTPTQAGARTGMVTVTDNASGSPQVVSLTGTGTLPPGISLLPPSLYFQGCFDGGLGSAPSQAATLTNNTSSAVPVSGITIGGFFECFGPGSSCPDFSQTNNCGTSLQAGQSCAITVNYSSTSYTVPTYGESAELEVTAGTSTLEAALSGVFWFCSSTISASPSSLTFGPQPVGTTSSPQTITLTGNQPQPPGLSTTVSGDFSASVNAPGGFARDQWLSTVTVTFTPTGTGTRAGSVTINTTGSNGLVTYTPLVIPVSGVGSGPAATLSAATISLGGQVVGTTSAGHTLTVTNTGSTVLKITSIAITPSAFSQTNTCGASLAAGASCTIAVTFTPPLAEQINGMLTITDNALGSPQHVSLSGVGQDFTIGPYILTETVNPGAAISYDFTVSPLGGFNKAVSLACSGAPQGATCTPSPASVVLDGRNHAVITLQVSTAAPESGGTGGGRWPALPPSGKWFLALGAAMLLGLLGRASLVDRSAPIPQARQLRLRVLALWGVLLMAAIQWTACGSGGLPASASPTGGTPAGNYTLTVTATSGNLTHSTNVQLTVR